MKEKQLKKFAAGALAAIMSISLFTSVFAEKMDYEVVITPQYETAGIFHNGYAAVKKDGKWGYIDLAGNVTADFKYDIASEFNEGKGIVGIQQSYGYAMGFVDESGNYTPLTCLNRQTNREEQYIADEGFISQQDENGDLKIGDMCFYNGYVPFWEGGGYCVIFDKNGKAIDNTLSYGKYDVAYLSGLYSDGLFMASPEAAYPENMDFFDINKNHILSFPGGNDSEGVDGFRVLSAYEFHNGYAAGWAMPAGEEYDESKYHLVLLDKSGHIAFARKCSGFSYRTAYAQEGCIVLNNGLIMLTDSETGKYGAVDINNNVHIPFEYDMLHPLGEGLASMQKNGLWGFVDAAGNVMIEPQYDAVTGFHNGVAFVLKDGKSMAIDRYNNVFEGSDKIPMDSYIKGSYIEDATDMMIIKDGEKYGYAKLSYDTKLPEAAEMSPWAYPEVIEAIKNNLVPLYLQNSYFSNITREDFAQLIVAALEEVTGKDSKALLLEKTGISKKDIYSANPFNDTNNVNVIIANKLGIINGVSDNSFAPANEISRQDAAALLMRAAQLISGNIEEVQPGFADNSEIADYAKKAVSYVTTLKIMNGVGDNRFDPTSTYTREQAYVTIVRLFNSLKGE